MSIGMVLSRFSSHFSVWAQVSLESPRKISSQRYWIRGRSSFLNSSLLYEYLLCFLWLFQFCPKCTTSASLFSTVYSELQEKGDDRKFISVFCVESVHCFVDRLQCLWSHLPSFQRDHLPLLRLYFLEQHKDRAPIYFYSFVWNWLCFLMNLVRCTTL